MKPKIRTEQQEAEAFADYLRLKGFLFTHLAQETSIKNWGLLMKQKRAGKNKGFPDYAIIANKQLLFVELKRTGNKSVVSPEQKNWIQELNTILGCVAIVAKGADEAKKFIESQLN